MVLLCFLLLQADLSLPGFYFWFLGGDLMQFWFIVLVVLGFVYWHALPMARGRSNKRPRQQSIGSFTAGFADSFGDLSRSQNLKLPFLLLRLPVVLLLVFLTYYFFIQGYTFRMNAHPTIASDCNDGSFTVEGNPSANTVSLKAGLLTIEGDGNYDQAGNTLNVNGNLCGFTLSVPANSNLNLSGNGSSISVTGMKGKIELDDNGGDITINGSRLLAGSVVSNNGGNITIDHSCLLDGSDVENNGGTITITNSNVSSKAKVDNNGSPITITSPITDGCPVGG